MRFTLAAGALALALVGCAGTSPQHAAYDAAAALTVADQAALVYVKLPRCSAANKLPCSDQATVDSIKNAAQKAHDAVKAAEIAATDSAASDASVVIAALVALIPTH